jgi:hypothetical protein
MFMVVYWMQGVAKRFAPMDKSDKSAAIFGNGSEYCLYFREIIKGEIIMKKTSVFVAMICTAALMAPLSVTSQEEEAPPGPLMDVWMIVPKAGMDEQFAEAVAAHMQFRVDAGEERTWQGYRVAVGHTLNVIQFRSCCFEWAGLDAHEAEDTEKGLSANWNENVGQYVDHYHHYLETVDWENSHWPFPDESTEGPYYGVTTWTHKQGRGPESNQARVKLSELAKEHGWADAGNEWLWLSREAGRPTTMIVSPHANFADMAPAEQSFFELLTENIGEEEAGEVFAAFSSGFTDSDYTVWVLDEAISTPESED